MNWRRSFYRKNADAEQQEELEFYVDVTTEEYIARGDGARSRNSQRKPIAVERKFVLGQPPANRRVKYIAGTSLGRTCPNDGSSLSRPLQFVRTFPLPEWKEN
jgi:hypothetical protein